VDYVANKLREAGYKVEIDNFEFPFFQELADPVLEQVTPNPVTYPSSDPAGIFTLEYSGSGDVTALIQPTVDVIVPMPPDAPASTSNSGCEGEFIEDADGNLVPNNTGVNDFEGFTPGNIALVQRGTCFFATKVVNAQAAGAVGVIVFNEGQPGRTDAFVGTLGGPVAAIPAVMSSYAIGEELFNLDQTPDVDVTVHLATFTESETRETVNVLADTRRGDDDHVIVVGAHLDSVGEGPGINDNGSGTAVILEIALQMAELKIRPLNRVRFAFWGAEEAGLLGSADYVFTLPEKELNKIALNLNFDMVGSPNFVRFVYDGDGSAGLSDPGPPGSAEIEHVFLDYFDDQGLETEPTAFDGRSDYGPFLDFGIPAGGLFSGAEEIKTPEQVAIYGGTAGEQFDPCYHLACDTFDNNSNEVLDQFSDAAAHTVLKFAIEGLEVQTTPLKTASTSMLDYKGPHLRR
jgi:Zn-dependent M28 family amino/carboxypeptidase